MAGPYANSLISAMLYTCAHANVILQTIAYPNPNPCKKNLKFAPRIPNPNANISDSCKRRTSAALVLGLGILDSALHLTQHSIVKELAQGAARRCSQVNTKIKQAYAWFPMLHKDL